MKNHISVIYTRIVLSIIILNVFYGCEIQEDFEYQKSESSELSEVTAWEFIQGNDSLSILEEAILIANLETQFQNGSAKTYIAPINGAFREYLEINSYLTIADVPIPILSNVLKYHIVSGKVVFTDPELFENNNPIAYTTENGQTMYLSHDSNFRGLINQGTSTQWQIATSNLEPSGNALHIVNSIVYFSAPSGDLSVPDPTIKTDTIFSIQDTYINGGTSSGVNFGSDVIMKVKNVAGDGNFDRKAYLMFDLKDFDKEGIITDLRLELAVKFTAAKNVSLDLYSIPDTLWTEMGLNFDNATFPTEDPVASITSSKIERFDFNITDFFNEIDGEPKVSLMLDAEAGSDETDEFASKENLDFTPPMLIATLASGDNVLEMTANSGFSVGKGESFVWNTTVLEITGASAGDIIFTVEEPPVHGWLIQGANILQAGDKFTQSDIDLMNLIYINDESGTSDSIGLSVTDKTGSKLDPFEVMIAIQ